VQELFTQGDSMVRIAEPYIVIKRGQSFQFTLNSTCGLPRRVCCQYQRKGFRTLPDELAGYRNPSTKPEAKSYVRALVAFLKKKMEDGGKRIRNCPKTRRRYRRTRQNKVSPC
jgi:hypothetical protein